MFKKILCALLASLMLVGSLASCANEAESSESENETITQEDTQVEEETRETLEIPKTRYDGTELCFLVRGGSGSWSTVEVFSDSKTANADNISYAVFERNDRILEDYGVTITEYRSEDHATAITNEVAAPTGDFMAVVSDIGASSGFTTSGFLWDLNSDYLEYMNFSKPWWDTRMAEGMSIDGRLFFVTGDIMTLDNDATFMIMFNKLLAKESQLPDLYELVDNNQWTMDKLYEFEQTSVRDSNGDGSLTYDTDVCGFAYTSDTPSCLLFAGGITLSQKDEDDIPYYELNLERIQEIVEKGKLILSKNYTLNMNGLSVGVEEAGKKCFGENHALFFGEVLQCVTRVRGYDVDFGILPYPKYNQEQDRYHSMMHTTASVVSIPRSVNESDLAMVESMIEAMAYHSVDTITKQYYEINLKTKGAKDVQSGPMIDTILANRACDLVYYYGWGSGAFGRLAGCMLPDSNTAVSSEAKKADKQINNNIKAYLRKMEKYQ